MEKPTPVDEATEAALFRMGAREGGRARARSLTPEQRSEIARRAAEARWDKKVARASYAGALIIGESKIECAVLDDGTRVLSQGTMLEALGRAKSMGRRKSVESDLRAPFISANNLEPFIPDELLAQLAPIEYKLPGNRFVSVGYRAETLPGVCEVYLDARQKGALLPSQQGAATAAEVLIRSLAKVGIIALVDEATGYQDVRSRDELRRLLEQYVMEEFRPWVKTFPDVFFEEIYRIYGWQWSKNTRRHPQYVGKFINMYIYDQLPDGVAEELRRVNPTNALGRRARRHHQHLTVDTGSDHLDKQILTVTTLLQVSENVDQFKELFARRFPSKKTRKVLRVDVTSDNQVETLFELEELES